MKKQNNIQYADHLEAAIGHALKIVGIPFVHESQNKEQGLDFYLPVIDVYIEVKQFHTDRISSQTKQHDNVIVLQGVKAVKLFCMLIYQQNLLI